MRHTRLSLQCYFAVILAATFFVAGCGNKPPAQPITSEVAVSPIATVINPRKADAAPLHTRQTLRFTDITDKAGITWKFSNGATGKHYFIETTGGGVALLDYNNDGRLDIFAPQGGPVPGATGEARNFPTRNVLYRNNGDGTFTDVTTGSGLDAPTGYGQGVAVADYDNDGWPDIYITAYGGNHLFHNNHNGTFTDVTRRAGVADTAKENPWPLSAAWGDYDGDGKLDLFVCHYCRWSLALNKDCPNVAQQLSYCRPQVYEPSVCRLYHNNGDGTFTDVTHKAGIDRVKGKSMGAAWFDFNDDGKLDLFVTNDSMVNFLLRNNGNGTFTDTAISAGVAYGEQDEASSGMGVGVGDYNNDGQEDIFVVNFSGQPKSVFQNLGHGLFASRSAQAGLAGTSLQFLAFGIETFDYDLDGAKDLIIGNGHVLEERDAHTNTSTYAQSQQLFHNEGNGTFAEDLRSLGDLALPRVTRGLAVGDIDNDGDWDTVMVSQTGAFQLFRNDGGNANRWITFRLEGVTCNRDAIGAKVTLHTTKGTQTQWVRSGSSYLSSSDRRVTFGLGESGTVTGGEIRWPNGKKERIGALAPNQFYWWREGQPPIADPRIKIKTPLLSAPH